MTHPDLIEIDGRRYVWREIVRKRREQVRAAAKAAQLASFELRDDRRAATERMAAGRYLEPSLFALPHRQNRRNDHAKSE